MSIHLNTAHSFGLTSRFASALQNSQLRKKLTSTTFLLAPFASSSVPVETFELEDVPSAAYRIRNTSQLDVAPRIDEISVRVDSGWFDR